MDVIKVAIPLVIYLVLMFFVSFFINKSIKVSYDKNASIAFTATGNNFELAIAVSIAVLGNPLAAGIRGCYRFFSRSSGIDLISPGKFVVEEEVLY